MFYKNIYSKDTFYSFLSFFHKFAKQKLYTFTTSGMRTFYMFPDLLIGIYK